MREPRAHFPGAALPMLVLALAATSRSQETRQVRGAYFHHYHERTHLEDLRRHGVNTLLVKFSQLAPEGNPKAVERLKRVAQWAKELRLQLFPIVNLMGGGAERTALKASPRRETTADGTVYAATPCPLDDRFWDEVVVRRGRLVAQLSRDHAIDAFVLDPEMYGADHTVFDGRGCFCDGCWGEFFKARTTAAPQVPAADRMGHLKQAKLLDAWRQWQSAKAEAMARRAREAIHAVNPKLRLGVLLLDYTQWVFPAWARGLGTPEQPVYAFSETTYSNGFTGYIAATQERFRSQGTSVAFVPGLWLSQFLPKELPGHLVRMAHGSGGYWLYTTYSLAMPPEKLKGGYRLLGPHDAYWRALAAANKALDRIATEGEAAIPPMARATALDRLRVKAGQAPPLPALRPVSPDGSPKPSLDAPATRLRGEGRYLLLAAKGETLRLRLRGHRLGHYDDVPVYVLLAPDGQPLAQGDLPLGEVSDVTVAAKQAGVHTLHMLSRSNTFSAAIAARHWAIVVPQRGLPLCQRAARLHFLVPPGAASFEVRVSGTGAGEGLLLKVLDPDGRTVAERDTECGKGFALRLEVPPQHRGKAWSVTCHKPRKGIFEDARLALVGVPPFVSESREALLVPAR